MKRKVYVMLVICLCIGGVSRPVFAGKSINMLTNKETSVQNSIKNIIYEDNYTIDLINGETRDVKQAYVKFRVYYDDINGLAFSTEVTADAFLKNIKGNYYWIPFTSGGQNVQPFTTTQIVPTGVIYNYTNIGYFYDEGTQIQCRSHGTITAIGGTGSFTKTAIVTIP